MDNSDICVCCGTQVPEGTMVCHKCSAESRERSALRQDYNVITFAREYLGLELRWYQRLLLRMYGLSLKISRKGLHR